MSYNSLGRTDMKVSSLSLGASSLGGMFAAVEDEDEAVEVVLRALKAGINLIDTAPWYRKSERLLGGALRRVPRQAYYINTKVGRYPPQENEDEGGMYNMFDFRAEKVVESVHASLEILGVRYLDCVHVHDPEFSPDLRIVLEETLPALAKLKEEGLVRYIGVAGYPLPVLTRLVREAPVSLDTCLTYAHCTLLDDSLHTSGFLASLEERGVGLINASPLAMGLLTHSTPPPWHPASEEHRALCRQAAAFCREHPHGPFDLARLALRFTLAQPRVPTTLLSTACLRELDANLLVLSRPLTAVESEASRRVREEILAPVQGCGWEGVEVKAYWAGVDKGEVMRRLYKGRGGGAGKGGEKSAGGSFSSTHGEPVTQRCHVKGLPGT